MTNDKLNKYRISVYKAEVKKLNKRIVQLESENRLQARALKKLGVQSITMTRTPVIDAIGANGCKISLQP